MAKRAKGGGGYGKPPRENQFRPGRSGNPKGRPRGSKNFSNLVAKELSGRVPITENGKKKTAPKGNVMLKQLINKAAGGDFKAAQAVLKLWQSVDQAEPPPDKTDEVFDTFEHQLTIANLVKRIRAMDPDEPADEPTNPKRKKGKK